MPHSENAVIEHTKQQLDYIKHITTLSTGSILLLATFLEKIFTKPTWRYLVVVSLIGFILSVIGAITIHTLSVLSVRHFIAENLETKTENIIAGISLISMWVGFLVGIVSLGVFAIHNL